MSKSVNPHGKPNDMIPKVKPPHSKEEEGPENT